MDDTPATKNDLQAVSNLVAATEERLLEAIHDSETRLLRAFHDWARGIHARTTRIETSDALTTERLTALENRVLELELRPRNGKPPKDQ